VFCPACRVEYQEGVGRCADCDVPLVDARPPEPPAPSGNVVTVFTTSDPSLAVLARGLLESADIPFAAITGNLQDFVGVGRVGTGWNVALGPVRFDVPEERAEEALALLERLVTPEQQS
jgi:hypothetical protein